MCTPRRKPNYTGRRFILPLYPDFGSFLLQLLPLSSFILVDSFKSIKCVAKDIAATKHRCCQKTNNESKLSQNFKKH